ncbi:melanization protease 1-like [Pectinophora gossypiella]|uniref:melanization protease 1-like n=1 Tax=Pectinophora gossypiella TaxID=13191 RepID=UPI00214E6B1A|nr:melanization protease 1-like [Pectinophora gossypiella]
MQLLVFLCLCVICVAGVFGSKHTGDVKQCGVEASTNLIHHNPWLVYLEYYNHVGLKKNIRCAATLIDSRHAVTAAHCVKKTLFSRLVARLGEYDVSTVADCVGGVCADPVVRINVIDVIVHEGYDGSKDDIAVIVLESDAPYTDFIRPICLPTGSIPHDAIFSAAGWGELTYTHIYSNIKKIIPLPHWSVESCKNAYRNSILPAKIICAGGEEGIDTCRGDSGGPLTLNKGAIEFWGVTSSGNVHCGTQGSPGIYTSVQDHLEWLENVVRAF